MIASILALLGTILVACSGHLISEDDFYEEIKKMSFKEFQLLLHDCKIATLRDKGILAVPS